ncbi:MAG TPA: type II toxin-antitoxin system VapC family toxin [Terracidiphilus sp.]|nr:type II toxin-antitoxin system VapC family toxin [Terracidiphilus sp.]
MIGLDTNVLIRFFTRDDPNQFKLAYKVLQSFTPQQPGWISLANLMEIDWVLRSRYGHDRAGVARLFDGLLTSSTVVVEQPATVAHSLFLYRTSKADFGECLIAASARAAGCSKVFTFDKTAARDLGMELIGAATS